MEKPAAPATSTPPATTSPPIQPGFDTYIVEEHRVKLMSYLIGQYSNTTPEQCGFMLYALVKLTHIAPSALNSNQSKLHRTMSKTFGSIGTRQALNTAILRLDTKGSSDEDKRNIAEHTQRISQFFRPANGRMICYFFAVFLLQKTQTSYVSILAYQ